VKLSVPALIVLLLQSAGSRPADAHGGGDLRIFVSVAVGRAEGGDRRAVAGAIDPGAIGKTVRWAFSRQTDQCGMGVRGEPVGDGDLRHASDGTAKNIYSAWAVQVTPTRWAGDAVTFRLQWRRTRDNGKPSTIGDDSEWTLRPGQSLSLDLMPQSPDAPGPLRSCKEEMKALSLSVALNHDPEPNQDRRLIAVDLWLVQRLPNGKERSQPLSLRGLYNQPIAFYFDTLTESTKTLDVFGDLQISPREWTTEIKITTRSRVVDLKPGPPPPNYPTGMPWPLPNMGSTTATLQLAPGEVVSVPLPPVGRGGTDAAVFAARALSFRIRVRQIR
jgi:hypothetical protein